MPTTVAIADDHPIVLRGLSALIEADPDFRVVATASQGVEALDAIVSTLPAIAVLDLNMPQRSGLEVLRELPRLGLPTRAVMLAAAATDAEIYDILDAGAAGLVFKEAATDQLLDCLRAVASGRQWLPVERTEGAAAREAARRGKWRRLSPQLTSREVEIVRLVIDGVTNKALAFRLQVSEGTTKVHLHNIFRKLEVGSRSELVQLAGGQAGEAKAAPN